MVAIIVAATLAPFAVRMHARGWSSLKAAGALTGALVLGVLAVVIIVILALVPVLTDVGTSISDAVTRLDAILVALPFGDAIQKLLDLLVGLARNVIGGEVATIAGSVATIATIAMLATFITFFLLLDGDKAWHASTRGMTDWSRERITRAGQDAGRYIGGYLRGTVATAIVKAVAAFVLLLLLGVPYPAPLAVLVFFGGFVPYVGAFVTRHSLSSPRSAHRAARGGP